MKSLLLNKYIYLILGIIIVTINIYLLPFFAWTTGIARSYFMLHGYLPYRDFTWSRNPFDIFLLSNWLNIFGVNEIGYQSFVYTLLILSTILVAHTTFNILAKKPKASFIFFIIFLFPLFINTEEGEIIIGLLAFLIFIFMNLYIEKRNLFFLFLSGIIGGLLFETKQNSAPIVVATGVVLVLDHLIERKKFFTLSRKFGLFILGFFIPIFSVVIYFISQDGIQDYINRTIFFVLGSYGHLQEGELTRGDGLCMIAAFISILLPFIIFWKKTSLKPQIVILLSLLMITSVSSLLPSFLSYRAFPSFVLISVVFGYTYLILANKQTRKFQKICICISYILFFGFTQRYIVDYLSFISQNGFSTNQFIRDYSDNEYKTAQWIRENTKKNEKIQIFANEIIYVLSDRLPKHKYIEPFPYILAPFEETSQIFIKNPPRLFVFDESLPEGHKGLENWPFLKYVKMNYQKKAKFDNLSIYEFLEKHAPN